MQEISDNANNASQPEPDSIRRLLAALGEWGVAEVHGAPDQTLEMLEDQALDAYQDVVAVA